MPPHFAYIFIDFILFTFWLGQGLDFSIPLMTPKYTEQIIVLLLKCPQLECRFMVGSATLEIYS